MENLPSFETPELKAAIDKYYPFLVEVRKRFFIIVAVFVAATTGGFFFNENIIRFLLTFLSLKGVNIVFTSPFQFINLAITSGVACGIIITVPLLIFQLLFFLKPALSRREYKIIIALLPFSMFLFVLGFLFGALVMKWQIEIFLSQSISIGIGNVLDVSRLLSTVMLTSVLMGVSFESPILLLALLRLGIVKPKFLGKIRPWVYLGSFIFAVILPPDSILADILLSIPLIVLFEFTLILNRLLGGKK